MLERRPADGERAGRRRDGVDVAGPRDPVIEQLAYILAIHQPVNVSGLAPRSALAAAADVGGGPLTRAEIAPALAALDLAQSRGDSAAAREITAHGSRSVRAMSGGGQGRRADPIGRRNKFMAQCRVYGVVPVNLEEVVDELPQRRHYLYDRDYWS